ncbi:MAG TPA: FAD-dependent oxidoreductase [Tenericutes bacterium]|nr:FAD-dependent oxidoreductase [Mycoplasmatota bacterium]
MKKISIWMDNKFKSKISRLKKDTEVDVLIIGGGITGLSIAYNLINKNMKVALVEKNKIGGGITSRTTGKITFLQQNIYSKIEEKYSFEKAELYYQSQKDAIKKIVNIIDKEKIDCNLIKNKSYLFSNNEDNLEMIQKEKNILEKFNEKVTYTNENFVIGEMKYQISVDNTYVFHPLKYLYNLKDICLKNNIDIYENTTVYNIERKNELYYCNTGKYKVIAKKVVLAIHYPYFLKPYFFPFKSTLEKSYVVACKVDKIEKTNGITPNNPSISFRYHENEYPYLIYLSLSHVMQDEINAKEMFYKLKNEVKLLGLDPSYVWSNHDIMTKDSLPIIGEMQDNLYIATGYNTWGMTNGTLAGMIISDLIMNKTNKYTKIFDPKRQEILQIGYSFVCNVKGFVKGKINRNKKFYNDKVVYLRENNKNIAIYKEGSKEYKVHSNCPHLGCGLIFNMEEKTWDCPCHGSRFNLKGDVILGPSNYSIKYDE